MTDLALVDETEVAVKLIESCIEGLSGEGRSVWTIRDIDPVINDLLDLWKLFHIPSVN